MKRIELGCRALLLTQPQDEELIGSVCNGIECLVIEGPYQSTAGSRCWSVAGPKVEERLSRIEPPHPPPLMNVPESRLIRIDDPDVKLDETAAEIWARLHPIV